jgi:hypothetical protein
MLDRRLRELRQQIRLSAALRAGSLLCLVAAGLVIVSLVVDRAFRLPLAARCVAQALYLGAFGWLAWRLLLRPVTRKLPDNALADLLERRYPDLLDRFRSAVEFVREPEVRESAPTSDIQVLLKRQVVRDAAAHAAAIDAAEVVDTPRVVSSLTAGVAGVAALAVLVGILSGTFGLWWRRNVLFEDVEWPYRTHLVVEGFPAGTFTLGVPRGDPLKIRVRAEGEIPTRVRIRLSYARESFASNLAREGENVFVYDHAEVAEAFTFDAQGGDFRTPPHRVLVLERPEVKEAQVALEFPAYTAKAREVLSGDIGELALPEGSTLHFQGRATKPLRGAALETEGRRVPLEIDASSPDRFSGAYSPAAGGMVTIHLDDLEGVPPNQWFRFLVTPVPDRMPVVQAAGEGIGSMITPNARIPFKVRAVDDYGVVALGVEYSVENPGATSKGPEEGALEARKGTQPFDPPSAPSASVEEARALEVGPLGIEPERRLDVRVTAGDNDGLHGSKTGRSATQSFLVVTPQRLGEDFLRREEEQRKILERVITDERGARDEVYRLIDEAFKAEGPLADAPVKDLARLARLERQLSRQVTGICGAMRLLRDEMVNNRLGENEEIERLVSAVIEPLIDVAERLLPASANRMGTIREMEKAPNRVEGGVALAGDLEGIIQRMEAVLASMKRLEGFTEVVNRLRAVIKVHQESESETKKSYRKEVDTIFEDEPRPTAPPTGPPTGPPGDKPAGNGAGPK